MMRRRAARSLKSTHTFAAKWSANAARLFEKRVYTHVPLCCSEVTRIRGHPFP